MKKSIRWLLTETRFLI